MYEESVFTSKTCAMLQSIPVDIRQKFPNSRTFSFACVKINGYNTVVVYKKIIPIAIVAEYGTHINPLALYDRWSVRNIFNTDWILSDTCRFFDVPSYVYPAR